jgi:hypothetical protein
MLRMRDSNLMRYRQTGDDKIKKTSMQVIAALASQNAV